MTQHSEQGAAQAVSIPPQSVILAMHWRYEQASLTFNRLDIADYQGGSKDSRFFNDRARRDLLREQDALRATMLRQIPDTWDEAAILTLHINNTYDLFADADEEDRKGLDPDALSIGLGHLFDFIVSEKIRDPAAIGNSFATEAERVRMFRRRRSGHGEG